MAQPVQGSDPCEEMVDRVWKVYEAKRPADLRFISGTLYQDKFPRATGHPFFETAMWGSGSLMHKGRSYSGIALRYDLYGDRLLYNHIHSSGSYIVALNPYAIDQFELDGKTFIHLEGQGFMELVLEGKATLYRKWSKSYTGISQGTPGTFSLSTGWYVERNGTLFRFRNRRGLLSALSDRKKETRAFIRKNRLVVSSGSARDITRIVDYYNSFP